MIIEVENLVKDYKYFEKTTGIGGSLKDLFFRKYNTRRALNNISFRIEKPDIIGLIGPNGAGKTTLLKILSGIIPPTEGGVTVLDYIPYKKANEFKKKIGFLMGNKTQAYWDLPANESFMASKVIYNIETETYKNRAAQLSTLLRIEKKLDIPVRNLSFGERMKVELILSLLHEPSLVFLDEPTIGLDYETQASLRNYIKDYFDTAKNTTFIITSHNLQDIETLCNRILLIKEGALLYDGKKKEMEGNCKKIILELNGDISDEDEKILTRIGYAKEGRYVYEKSTGYDGFRIDFINYLEKFPIKDISYKEEDFQKVLENYIGRNHE